MERLVLMVGLLILIGAVLQLTIRRRRHGDRVGPRTGGWLKYGVFLVVVLGLLVAARSGQLPLALVLLAVTLRGLHELRCAFPGAGGPVIWAAGGALVGGGLGHLLIVREGGGFGPVAFVVTIVASTDAFSQLWGQLLGRRQLCGRLSPAKTVEGTGGGLLTAVAVSMTLGPLLPRLPVDERAGLALVTAVAAVLGDLVFSTLKRAAGIKDFATFLPGHGGILDRFDSLVLAAPAYYWFSCRLAG